MHPTAMANCKTFFETYENSFDKNATINVIEIGSQDVNGSLREVCPKDFVYTGLDFQKAKGVDIVLNDPYLLPLESESVDIVLSSSCFEHSEMFWLVYLEIMRVLKPHGLFYLNVPSSGDFHRFPLDCWRFYPDSGKALVTWDRKQGGNSALLESFTQIGGKWQDYVSIFIKDSNLLNSYPKRIIETKLDYENGQIYGSDEIFNPAWTSQNEKKLQIINKIVNEQIALK